MTDTNLGPQKPDLVKFTKATVAGMKVSVQRSAPTKPPWHV